MVTAGKPAGIMRLGLEFGQGMLALIGSGALVWLLAEWGNGMAPELPMLDAPYWIPAVLVVLTAVPVMALLLKYRVFRGALFGGFIGGGLIFFMLLLYVIGGAMILGGP